ncbi:hypothetical protein FRB97_004496, partial [Tulasnella sp. 331]
TADLSGARAGIAGSLYFATSTHCSSAWDALSYIDFVASCAIKETLRIVLTLDSRSRIVLDFELRYAAIIRTSVSRLCATTNTDV